MRITGGFFKGRNLFFKKKPELRPTRSIVREAIFDMLGNKTIGAHVLDLFAGTGAFGFEALSRGASKVIFVDKSVESIEIIKKNTENLKLKDLVEIMKMDVELALKKLCSQNIKFDIIFADPPYVSGMKKIEKIVSDIFAVLKDNGIFVVEMAKDRSFSKIAGMEKIRDKIYGATRVQIYQKKGTACCISG